METTFYSTSAAAAFALLGLWWVVVAERRTEWLRVGTRRRQAYTVSLYFALPGIMSLISLVSQGQTAIWRLAFGVAGAVGAIETGAALLAGRHQADYRGRVRALLVTSLPLYVVIIVVAISPLVAHDLGISLKPLETEALAVSMLMFLGINFAWLLFFEPSPGQHVRGARATGSTVGDQPGLIVPSRGRRTEAGDAPGTRSPDIDPDPPENAR